MFYDIAVKVTPDMIAANPEYEGLDVLVFVTTYTQFMANLLLKLLQSVSVEGTELIIVTREGEERDIKVGVLVDD